MNKFLTNLGQTFSDDEKAVIKTKLESILGTDQIKMAWYPTVGNDGTIQWGLSAYSTQAPNPANIKGPQGEPGNNGVNGEPGTSVTIENIVPITGGRKVIFSDGNEITIYDGKDGAGVAIKGTVDNVADLPSTAENGDAYIVKNDDGKLYVYANGWPAAGVAFTGPKGADGDTPTLAFIENSEKTGIDIFVNGGEEPVNTIPYATDGHSPIITTTATSTGNDIYIDGIKAFSVTNGTNGNAGKDGYTPEATTTDAPADASHLNGGTKVTLSWPADASWLSPVSFTAWNGNNGTNGTTWKPSVSDAGVLSWTTAAGTPTTANIKGPQGPAGDTWKPTVNEDGDLSWTTAAGKPTTANIKGPAGNDGITPTVTVTAATSTTHLNGGTEVKFDYGDGDERNTSFTAWNGNDGMAGDLPAAPTEAGKYVLNKPTEGDVSWVDYEADAYTLTGDGKFISVTENAGTVTVGLTTTDITGDNPYVMTTAGWTNGAQYYAHVKTVGDIDSVASAINIITHNNSTGTNYNKISGYGYNNNKQQTAFEAFLLPNHWTRMFSSGANATTYAGTFVKVTPSAASNNAWYDIEPNITASDTTNKKFAWDPTNNTWAAITEGGEGGLTKVNVSGTGLIGDGTTTANLALDPALLNSVLTTAFTANVTGTDKYVYTTAGWTAFAGDYLPLTGGTVDVSTGGGRLRYIMSDNYDATSFVIQCGNNEVTFGVSNTGGCVMKAASVNSQLVVNDVGIQYTKTNGGDGSYYAAMSLNTSPIKIVTTAELPATTDDNTLYFVLE